ncbi:MAG: CocE/NonD family hydrolase [Candidatus Rokubacteria bacterium]|nr:CocE/NonD family hydrolase [Candidatus Rokubacteria bacterium]
MTKPQFDVVVMKNVMVPVRDGVRLAADVYLPARHGRPARPGGLVDAPVPALVERTPYSKDNGDRVELNGLWYAERGYAVVLQDVRGRYRSEGTFGFLRQEAEDGYDSIEWIAAQPWCNGTVGTFGLSYGGWTQSTAAALNPPHLAAMWVDEAGANAWTSCLRHNGAFEMRWLCWALWQGAKSHEAKADPVLERALASVNVREWLGRMPLKRGASPLALIPAYEAWAFDIATRGDGDDELWQPPGFNIERHWDGFRDCPQVHLSGWYDSYTRATLENFTGLGARKRGPVRCVMGPWIHSVKPLGQTFSGDVDFGAAAAIDHNEERLAFFDAALREMETAWTAGPPLRLFVMGGGSGRRNAAGRLEHGGGWRDERQWPLPRTRFTDFHLHPGGGLRPERPRAAEASSAWPFDPRHPVPTIGGNMSSLVGLLPRPAGAGEIPVEERERDVIGIAGAFDQREDPRFFGCAPPWLPLASRPDVLVFQTEPLGRDQEVTGPVTVRLWVSSDAPDTDVTVKLVDVYPPSADYPNGFAMNVTDSILRLRWRHGPRAELLAPGTIHEVAFPLYPTSNVFGAGHRIRLDVSSSNYPRFDVNPNTGEPLWASPLTRVATNRIHHDAAHPSHLTLPVIEG